MSVYPMTCSRHGVFMSFDGSECPCCTQDVKDGKLFVTEQKRMFPEDNMTMEAAHSFRYRLREAAKQALTLGDTLLQMSQDAGVPDAQQLEELRSLETTLDVAVRYRIRDIKAKCERTG